MTEQPLPFGSEEKALLMLGGLNPLAGAAEVLEGVERMERFVWLSNEHGVAAFVRKNIDGAGLTALLPPSDYQSLRNQSFRSVARNSFIMSATFDAVRLLNGAGFTPVLLKGTALEKTVYRESGLRPMTDADILLPADECLTAWKFLQAEGYESLPLKSPLHRLILMHTGKHLPSLIKGGFSLEIHHSLWKENRGREKGLVEGSELIVQYSEESHSTYPEDKINPSDGTSQRDPSATPDTGQVTGSIRYRIPPPGLHFLYLAAHLAKHEEEGHSQLRLYNDLVAMLGCYDAKTILDEAFAYAGSAEQEQDLRNRLGLLEKYMGVELPVEYHFVPEAKSEEQFLRFLASPKNNPPEDRRRAYRQSIRSIPGIHRKLLFVAGDIFPSFTFMKKRYGRKSIAAVLPYYFLRPGKLLWLIR